MVNSKIKNYKNKKGNIHILPDMNHTFFNFYRMKVNPQLFYIYIYVYIYGKNR